MRSILAAALFIGLSGAAHAQLVAHPAIRAPILAQPPIQIQPPPTQSPGTMTQQLHGNQDFNANQDLPNSPAAEQNLLATPLQSRSLPSSQFGGSNGLSQPAHK